MPYKITIKFYFNPRFPWGKRPGRLREVCKGRGISIHASRGGSDIYVPDKEVFAAISIHASRGGSDSAYSAAGLPVMIFQSTLPVGEATIYCFLHLLILDISIHASRGGSDIYCTSSINSAGNFNPRFPWGKRHKAVQYMEIVRLFQSTLPVGEATEHRSSVWVDGDISIHASRGGSDSGPFPQIRRPDDFNPRFPWGKRRHSVVDAVEDFGISIHASRGGSDVCSASSETAKSDFNPRFPWGKRRLAAIKAALSMSISIHASRGGSDRNTQTRSILTRIFQSTLPVGEATLTELAVWEGLIISIHASRGGSDHIKAPPCRTALNNFNPRFPWGKRPGHREDG